MSNYELLREKAIQVCERCKTNGLPQPQFSVVSDYSVNLKWHNEGTIHTLAIAYSPKRQRWTLSPNSDWLKNVVCPLIQAVIDSHRSEPSSLSETSAAFDPHNYFIQAQESLNILEPYANENVDCSIICELTRAAVNAVLRDLASLSLDQPALLAVIGMPNTTNFFAAKEYFTRCLNLCTRNSHTTN